MIHTEPRTTQTTDRKWHLSHGFIFKPSKTNRLNLASLPHHPRNPPFKNATCKTSFGFILSGRQGNDPSAALPLTGCRQQPQFGIPSWHWPLQEAESCINFQHSFFPFLSYSIPASLQLEFTLIAKTETSNNLSITLSLVFSSVLTMAKIQAHKWQHIGKALTFQTRTQTEWCSVNIQNYGTPLDCESILKKKRNKKDFGSWH